MNATIINIKQGSQEWLNLRKSYYGASEVNTALGRCKWAPKTYQALADIKLGKKQVYCNNAMKDGICFERRARELISYLLDTDLEPITYIAQDKELPLMASLDGINFNGDTLVEIKTSTKDLDELVDYYYYQIQQQLLLSKANVGYLIKYNKEKDAIQMSKEIKQDENAIKEIIQAWEKFHKFFKEVLNEK